MGIIINRVLKFLLFSIVLLSSYISLGQNVFKLDTIHVGNDKIGDFYLISNKEDVNNLQNIIKGLEGENICDIFLDILIDTSLTVKVENIHCCCKNKPTLSNENLNKLKSSFNFSLFGKPTFAYYPPIYFHKAFTIWYGQSNLNYSHNGIESFPKNWSD